LSWARGACLQQYPVSDFPGSTKTLCEGEAIITAEAPNRLALLRQECQARVRRDGGA